MKILMFNLSGSTEGWDEADEKKIHSCPECRQTVTLRPVLVKSTMFAVLVEKLRKTGLQAAPANHCYAGPEDLIILFYPLRHTCILSHNLE